jgi:hypothetical protein
MSLSWLKYTGLLSSAAFCGEWKEKNEWRYLHSKSTIAAKDFQINGGFWEKTNGTIKKCSSRPFQMSVFFANLNVFEQFLWPALGDRCRHQLTHVHIKSKVRKMPFLAISWCHSSPTGVAVCCKLNHGKDNYHRLPFIFVLRGINFISCRNIQMRCLHCMKIWIYSLNEVNICAKMISYDWESDIGSQICSGNFYWKLLFMFENNLNSGFRAVLNQWGR